MNPLTAFTKMSAAESAESVVGLSLQLGRATSDLIGPEMNASSHFSQLTEPGYSESRGAVRPSGQPGWLRSLAELPRRRTLVVRASGLRFGDFSDPSPLRSAVTGLIKAK